MSFQAYLDNVEQKTGRTPEELVALARERGLDAPGTKATPILEWLARDFGLGRGHAMAVVHVLRNGDRISPRHVGTSGPHRDPSATLRLSGREA